MCQYLQCLFVDGMHLNLNTEYVVVVVFLFVFFRENSDTINSEEIEQCTLSILVSTLIFFWTDTILSGILICKTSKLAVLMKKKFKFSKKYYLITCMYCSRVCTVHVYVLIILYGVCYGSYVCFIDNRALIKSCAT